MANIKLNSLLVFLVLAAVTETVRGGESQQHAIIVLSSQGAAALIWPELLGQYEYDEEKECYVQSSTEQSNEAYTARYLYKDEDDDWVVGPTPGGETFWMYNTNSTNLTTGDGDWFVTFNHTWYFDPSMTVTPGPLPPLPSQFIVTASSSGEYAKISDSLEDLGVFNKTERWWAGRPVYMNTQGQFLYHGLQSWTIGHKLGYHTLRGSKSYKSPADVKSWTYHETETTTYHDGYSYTSSNGEKPASVTVLEATQPNLKRYKEDRERIQRIQHNLKKRQYGNSSVSYSYSYDNSGIIIAVISVVVTVLGAIIGVIRCARKYSKSEEATVPSQPPQNVVPMNQVENASEQPHHPPPSLQPGQDQMDRAMAPTPYSVNQSWNTRSGQPTPYLIQ